MTLTTTHVSAPPAEQLRTRFPAAPAVLAPRFPVPRHALDPAPAPRPTPEPLPPAAGPLRSRRHLVVVATGAATLPVLALLGAAAGHSAAGVLAAVLGPAVLLVVAVLRVLPARLRTGAAAAGLVAACSTAVALCPGTTELHFSYFLAVVLLGVYRDGSCFAVAAVVVVLWPDLAAAVGDAGATAAVAGVVVLHLALVGAAAAVALVGWALEDADSRRR